MKKQLDVTTIVDKGISATVASAVLLASCTPSNELSQSNRINERPRKCSASSAEPEHDIFFRSTAIALTDTDKQLLSIFSELAQDILSEPSIAAEFSADPLAYLEQRGYTYQGDIDAGLLQMVTAFADDDIRNAIEERDVNGFIELCRDKGLLAIPTGLNEESFKSQLKSFSNNMFVENDTVSAPIAVVAVLVVAIVLVFVVVEGPDCDDPPCFVAAYDNLSPFVLWAYDSHDTYIPIEDEWTQMQFAVVEETLMNYDPRYTSDSEYHDMVENIVKSTLLNTL